MSPSIIVFPDKYVLGWPKADDARAIRADAADVLAHRYQTDAHFVAYTADIERRHTVHLLRCEELAERIPDANVRMTLAVFDVDGTGHKFELPYTDAQWSAEQPKLAALLGAHPGGFLYRTRGGYRIVFALPEPFALRSRVDDAKWTAVYISWCRYLSRAFGITADVSCADWTRPFRAPHATRDGVALDLETIGDVRSIGVWAPKLTAEDRVRPKRVEPADFGEVEPVPLGDMGGAYARRRIVDAAEYLRSAPLSIKGQGGRTTMFGVCLTLVRRMRLPLDVAAELIDAVYNPRLRAAGTSTWTLDSPGPHGGCIVERLEKARDTGTVPIGSVVSEEMWNDLNGIGRSA